MRLFLITYCKLFFFDSFIVANTEQLSGSILLALSITTRTSTTPTGGEIKLYHNGDTVSAKNLTLDGLAWHHIAAVATTFAGSPSLSVSLYLNGTAVTTTSITRSLTTIQDMATLGEVVDDSTVPPRTYGHFIGLMQDVRVYTRSLTAAVVRLLARGNESLIDAHVMPNCLCPKNFSLTLLSTRFCSSGAVTAER